MQLVGDLIHKFGREAAERIVEEHYRRNQDNIRSSLEEHQTRVRHSLGGDAQEARGLTFSRGTAERSMRSASEHQREGFMIVRAFAGAAAHNGKKDFAIARASLADRRRITRPGATDVIQKLCELKVIAPTEAYVRHQKSARFCWVLSGSVTIPRARGVCLSLGELPRQAHEIFPKVPP